MRERGGTKKSVDVGHMYCRYQQRRLRLLTASDAVIRAGVPVSELVLAEEDGGKWPGDMNNFLSKAVNTTAMAEMTCSLLPPPLPPLLLLVFPVACKPGDLSALSDRLEECLPGVTVTVTGVERAAIVANKTGEPTWLLLLAAAGDLEEDILLLLDPASLTTTCASTLRLCR
jgi:hypothetical protein